MASFKTALPPFTQARQWLCAGLEWLPFLPHPPSYKLSIGREPAFVWYRVAKVATRTIFTHFLSHGVRFEVGQAEALFFFPSLYRRHFKFAFVRNPWSRLVSCWQNKVLDHPNERLFAGRTGELQTFESFVDYVSGLDLETCDIHLRLQVCLIDTAHLDFLGRLERFDEDFATVCGRLGIPGNVARVNASARRPDYRTYYTDALAERVARLYQRDIAPFGYTFDPPGADKA